MSSLWRAAALFVALFAVPGLAQSTYTITSYAQPYVPLSGATTVSLAKGGYDASDEGYASIPLGFTFPFYGKTYSSVGVNSNGVLVFGAAANTACSYTANQFDLKCTGGEPIPSAKAPNGFIAPWNADHNGTAGSIRYVKPNPSEMVIEYWNWSYFGSTTAFSFQVRLNGSGLIQVHYGTHGAGSGSGSVTVGIEADTGSQGVPFLPCGANGACSASDWPANTLFTIGQPVQADLVVQTVQRSNVVRTGNNISLTVSPTFRNFGQTSAAGFHWKAYLSTNQIKDAADIQIFDSQAAGQAPLTCAGATATNTPVVSATGNGSATNVAVGNYFVLVEVDTTNAVAEFSETNNVGATASAFTFGIDLVAKSVSGPTQTGPGNTETVTVEWENQGSDAAPTVGNVVQYQILLSADQTFDSGDFVVHTGTEVVTGGATFSAKPVTFQIPGNVPGGDYYWGLRVDSNTKVVEADESNNVAFAASSSKFLQADLEAVSADLLDPKTLQPTRTLNVTELGRAQVKVSNLGGAIAQNFSVGVVLSKDSNLSLLNDTLVHEENVGSLPAGGAQTYAFDFLVPAMGKNGAPFTTGTYFVFLIVDSGGAVTELSKANNVRGIGKGTLEPVSLRTPAPDYTVIQIDAPATAAVGEVLPVHRVIKNVGNKDGKTVSYRYFASANDIITTDDMPLPLLGPNGQTLEAGEVTLTRSQTHAATEFVRVPPLLVPGTWYIGAIVDAANVEEELDETNNAFAAISTLQVAASGMVVATSQPPDAVVGFPYAYLLSTAGAAGPVTWSTDAELPEGLTLSAQGLLGGTAAVAGVTAFNVYAQSGQQVAAARLVLRVLPPSGGLAITTTGLPPVENSTSKLYTANLAAAGGSKPYRWSLLGGTLPDGLALAEGGTLSGTLRSGVPVGESPLLFEVVDHNGTRARAALKLRVVQPGALVIRTVTVPDTMVNADYLTDFSAVNLDGSPLEKPLTWTVSAGRLPEGVALTVAQDELGLLTGKPLEQGTFTVSIQVQDAKGRFDVADYVLRVHPARLKLSAVNLPVTLHPGDEVTFQITTGGASGRYRIYSGSLPPGLTMNENGTVSGTVETENSVGTWNFVAEAQSPQHGSSLGAFSLEVTKAPKAAGCSTAPGGAGLFALLAPLAGLLVRRRKTAGALAAVVLAGVVAAPSMAQAQQYTVLGPTPQNYAPLSSGTLLNVTTTAGATATLPFEFEFYGVRYNSVVVSLRGYLTFGDNAAYSANQGIPHSSTNTSVPRVLIAPWWDALGKHTSATQVRYSTQGSSPNRTFVVEWANLCNTTSTSCAASAQFSFQVRLSEGSNRIRVSYGPGTASASASVGIMGGTGIGQAGLPCTTVSSGLCSSSHFPTNQILDFALPADLQITSVNSDDTGYANVPFQVALTLVNRGGLDAQGAAARLYLSTDAVLSPASDIVLGDSNATTVTANGQAQVTAIATVPGGTAPGSYFLLAAADATGVVPEGTKENNNTSAPLVFSVGGPTPDLTFASISGPNAATSGATLAVNRVIQNVGNAEVSAPFSVTYFVSDNSVVTVSDVAVGTSEISSLAAGQSDQGTQMVTLPGDLRAGKYWIGACVDYNANATPPSTVTEISEVNNCATGNAFVLNTGALAVVTTTLPMASENAPFGLRLEASGGDGSYQWALAGGELPPGVSLSTAGDLVGTPGAAGEYSFTVKVSSAGEEQTQALSLSVMAKDLPLTIVDQDLPTAEFGRGYAVQLVAVGGQPPYTWTLKEGARLPQGLAISPDGFVEGRPGETSTEPFAFTVNVVDKAGTQAAKDLQIRVVTPGSMHLATTQLATAYLESNYRQNLEAVGGSGSYTFSVVRFQQLAQTAADRPGPEESRLPDGFGITLLNDAGLNGAAQLIGTPARAGLYAVTFRVQDNQTNAEDITTLPLLVSYKKALSITTLALPDAFVGQSYNARLSHSGGEGTIVSYEAACLQQAQSGASGFTYSCVTPDAMQQIPPGLLLGADGTLSGTAQALPPAVPAATDADGAPAPKSAVYSFLVKVTDSNGRSDLRSLSIKVREAPAPAGGCSGTGLGPAALGLLALLGVALRRRG